jgi:hypothetical protein
LIFAAVEGAGGEVEVVGGEGRRSFFSSRMAAAKWRWPAARGAGLLLLTDGSGEVEVAVGEGCGSFFSLWTAAARRGAPVSDMASGTARENGDGMRQQ